MLIIYYTIRKGVDPTGWILKAKFDENSEWVELDRREAINWGSDDRMTKEFWCEKVGDFHIYR